MTIRRFLKGSVRDMRATAAEAKRVAATAAFSRVLSDIELVQIFSNDESKLALARAKTTAELLHRLASNHFNKFITRTSIARWVIDLGIDIYLSYGSSSSDSLQMGRLAICVNDAVRLIEYAFQVLGFPCIVYREMAYDIIIDTIKMATRYSYDKDARTIVLGTGIFEHMLRGECPDKFSTLQMIPGHVHKPCYENIRACKQLKHRPAPEPIKSDIWNRAVFMAIPKGCEESLSEESKRQLAMCVASVPYIVTLSPTTEPVPVVWGGPIGVGSITQQEINTRKEILGEIVLVRGILQLECQFEDHGIVARNAAGFRWDDFVDTVNTIAKHTEPSAALTQFLIR